MRRSLIIVWLAAMVIPLAATADDADGDGIADDHESRLLQRFAPVLYRDYTLTGWQDGHGIPVSVSWALANGFIIRRSPASVVLADHTSVASALAAIRSVDGASDYGIRFDDRWGDVAGDPTSWPDAINRGAGVYGRVWRPFQDHPHILSIQYYILLTWNETTYTGGAGNHEGDWLCLDFAVDIRSSPESPPIIHAIYHNHGRQHFLAPEALRYEDGHPVAYLENGTNELWPLPGPRGTEGWPNTDGFSTNFHFDEDDPCGSLFDDFFCNLVDGLGLFGGISEFKIVRSHLGEGNRYATREVPNIGDFRVDNGLPVSLCGDEGQFILEYKGLWGVRSDEPGEPPAGPPYQGSFWERSWKTYDGVANGPWAMDTSPFNTDLAPFHLHTTPGYSFAVPPLRQTLYVDFSRSGTGDGSLDQPFGLLAEGLAFSLPNGSIVLRGGNSAELLTISQPVILTADSGVVTIGQE